jgi:hypothetical protein
MKTNLNSILRAAARVVLCAGLAVSSVSISSCVTIDHSAHERIVTVLPHNARAVDVNGERCWTYNGVFYRKHPQGYVIFLP